MTERFVLASTEAFSVLFLFDTANTGQNDIFNSDFLVRNAANAHVCRLITAPLFRRCCDMSPHTSSNANRPRKGGRKNRTYTDDEPAVWPAVLFVKLSPYIKATLIFVVTLPEPDLNRFSRRSRTALLDIKDAPCTYGCCFA